MRLKGSLQVQAARVIQGQASAQLENYVEGTAVSKIGSISGQSAVAFYNTYVNCLHGEMNIQNLIFAFESRQQSIVSDLKQQGYGELAGQINQLYKTAIKELQENHLFAADETRYRIQILLLEHALAVQKKTGQSPDVTDGAAGVPQPTTDVNLMHSLAAPPPCPPTNDFLIVEGGFEYSMKHLCEDAGYVAPNPYRLNARAPASMTPP